MLIISHFMTVDLQYQGLTYHTDKVANFIVGHMFDFGCDNLGKLSFERTMSSDCLPSGLCHSSTSSPNTSPTRRVLRTHSRSSDKLRQPSSGIHRVMSTSALRIPKQRNSFWQRYSMQFETIREVFCF